MPLQSALSDNGEVFYVKGDIFKTSELSLVKKIHLLTKVYKVQLCLLADVLNMSPQQFSYKIHHHLNVSDIYKLSKYLHLNDTQIVNIFLKY